MAGVMPTRLLLVLAIAIAAIGNRAAAQELYRWTDKQGREHVTDTAPPPGARNVRKINPGPASSKPSAEVPYVLDVAMKQYPVTLYTSPNCAAPCGMARELLNRRPWRSNTEMASMASKLAWRAASSCWCSSLPK